MTPEGKVKAKIKAILKEYGVYYFMPVQNGMGMPGLDFHCTLHGMSLYIEAKAPGKNPTKRQEITMESMRQAGAIVIVCDGSSYDELEETLKVIQVISNAANH